MECFIPHYQFYLYFYQSSVSLATIILSVFMQPGGASIMGFQHVEVIRSEFDGNMGGAPALVGESMGCITVYIPFLRLSQIYTV